MDPNATLTELRTWADNTLAGSDTDPERAAELIKALDEWIVARGFLPSDWAPRSVPTSGKGSNTGHGHAWPRPDGLKARCGGINKCGKCRSDFNQY